MEPENPDDRPESPKKKIRPSSTTNSEVSDSVSRSVTGSVVTLVSHSGMNGYGGLAAPKRNNRFAEPSSSTESTNQNGPTSSNSLRSQEVCTNPASDQPKPPASIQEEVVSSSESTMRQTSVSDGDADTNEAEVLSETTG